MFLKLRSDLALKLSNVKLLLVNAGGFSVNGSSEPPDGLAVEGLRDFGVECVAFSESTSEDISTVAEALGIVLHQGVSEKLDFYKRIKEEYSVMDSEIALISTDDSDVPIIKRAGFSAVTVDACLDVKKYSYYAAYGKGQSALSEIAALITRAKSYPSGWSE